MNWKLVILGGLALYVTTFAIGMVTGVVIHEGILDPLYQEHSEFWRPELRQDPPDMAALMPRWIATGLATSFVIAGIYGAVHKAFSGAGWSKGLKYGVVVSAVWCTACAGFSGVFDLPDKLWLIWGLESFLYYLPGGAVLGLLHEKFLAY